MIATKQRTGCDISDVEEAVQVQQDPKGHEQTNQEIIKSLEKEIHSLEQRVQQFRDSPMLLIDDKSAVPTLESITEEILVLEQLVKENEILSGLTLSEVSCSVLKQDAGSSHRQHTIIGEAGGMQFKLEFEVREQFEKLQNGKPQAEILMLEMDVREDMVTLLKSHLYSIAAEVNVQQLFRLLSSYGLWLEDRERAINHFVSTFPDLVQNVDAEDGNNKIVIMDPKQDLKLCIIWGLKVLPFKSVVPSLQLLVEASPEVLARDSNGTLKAAPEVFQLLLKNFGIESAIHMLIKLMDVMEPIDSSHDE